MKLFFLLLISAFSMTSAAKASINSLLGSWKMKEIHYIYDDKTHSVSHALTGAFMFTPERYMIMYNPWKNPRVAFEVLSKPTEQEMIASFKTIVYNSGSYTYTNEKIATKADIAKVPGFEGGQQFYQYQIKDNLLDITMIDETYPDGTKPEWFGKLKVRFVLERE